MSDSSSDEEEEESSFPSPKTPKQSKNVKNKTIDDLCKEINALQRKLWEIEFRTKK